MTSEYPPPLLMKDNDERDELTEKFGRDLLRFEAMGKIAYTGPGGHTYWEDGWAKQRVRGPLHDDCGCGGHGERLADDGYDSRYGSHGDCGCGGSSSSSSSSGGGGGGCSYGTHDVTAIGPGGHSYSTCSSYPAGGTMCYVTKKVCNPDCSCRLVVTDSFFRRDCGRPSAGGGYTLGYGGYGGGGEGRLLGDASYRYGEREYGDERFRVTQNSYSSYGVQDGLRLLTTTAAIGSTSGEAAASSATEYEAWRAQALSSEASRTLLPAPVVEGEEAKA